MKSFLTGSRVYGTPNENSDTDLVLRMEPEEALILSKYSDGFNAEQMRYGGGHCLTMRFGGLNLIICMNDESYAAWKISTLEAKKLKPLSKGRSGKLFHANFVEWGQE